MEINFAGKRALVTGAGKGIGHDTAKMLVKCGADVIALSRTQSDLDSLRQEVPQIQTVCVDLNSMEETRKVVSGLGDIHLLINNAAVSMLEPFTEVTEEAFDLSFSVNVKAALFLSQIVAKGMIARGNGGSIVNISSQASQSALKDHTVYCCTKAALDMLGRMMALELGPHKIRVNTVNPTVVMTDMGKIGWSDPVKAKEMLDKIPLGRFSEVDEVVNAIVFLLSDKASMIHGVTLPVDGGYLAT
ncbi:L-xylulose reductase [Paramuricea clavata]|uniref:L-xylulose reductase n=1 Tax=Paramuricea clavata TaxID=317549 RepID=A0A6S7GZ39_PARCT|nr:L-xylulose reductase [Paramuricea clavata]